MKGVEYLFPGSATSFFYLLKGDYQMLESKFQTSLIKEIKDRYPGAVCLKNDPNYLQGVPDWSIFFNDRYALLEVKKSENEPPRPNQPYYVELFGEMSFSAFIYPENKDEVLLALDIHFGVIS